AIQDLSVNGRQPMVGPSGASLVLNGEVYNAPHLREELQSYGHRFWGRSDTEVALRAYEQWGHRFVGRIRGMFAIAIWDPGESMLLLARDRLGIKPLYYADRPDWFGFASEMKALLAPFPELRQPNYAFLHHFLPSGALDDGPETVFEGVEQLLPAHSAIYDISAGTFRTWRYWEVEPDVFRDRWVGNDPVGSLRALLDSAIQLHMRSDVPVGTCLSGGLDSSTIVCWMSGLRNSPVHTYSGLYTDKDCDEAEYVEAVRRHTGCIGADIRREPDGNLLEDMATITWHQDMPTAGPGLYTQFNVMERASHDVKVILDGQGGDELFAGYLPYYRLRLADLLSQRSISASLEACRLALTLARHWGPKWLNARPDQLFPARVVASARALRRRLRGSVVPENEHPFFHPSLGERVGDRLIQRTSTRKYPDQLSQTLYLHTVEQSIPALLHYEDRNSMAYSIEARVPFLDYRMVEFALGLPPDLKIRDTWTKWVLRKAAEPRVPKTVTWRRSKLGYPTPAARWLRQPRDRDALSELLFSSSFLQREVAARESVEYYWNRHQNGKADHSWVLYRYATLELWYRQFIDGFEPRPARIPQPRETVRRAPETAWA
ncbi:MAG: asparagine synthase (glutamine-hydrolyzing), partial [Acetobacteraceae bacterium]|nr:asparagine synthase (glutamine-hydrolyzing) [Acetobacteraceae bacterium]